MVKTCSLLDLRESLNASGGKKFKVTTFCKIIEMDRSVFYSVYKNGSRDLFVSVIEIEINKHFMKAQNNSKVDSGHIMDSIILQIRNNWKIYRWMYESLNYEGLAYVRENLIDCIFRNFQDYAFNRKGISKNRLKPIVNCIYSQLFDWTINGCEVATVEIHAALKQFVPMLEGHRCDADLMW
ncbi:hypothetical protein [Lactobacillus kalixensis]|nr:hypothetical protein [Lactobacillus kalixensis]